MKVKDVKAAVKAKEEKEAAEYAEECLAEINREVRAAERVLKKLKDRRKELYDTDVVELFDRKRFGR